MSSIVLPESPTVSLVAAGRAIGIGRSATYRLVQRGDFPLPVIHAGSKLRVPTAALRRILALDDQLELTDPKGTLT